MSLGRRKVGLDDPSRWVFNRMAEFYDARPAYPRALIDALAELAGPAGSRIGDLGAGVGHLALPLAARGFEVVAIEAAHEMLDRLRATAEAQGTPVRTVHAAVEALPLEPGSLDLAVIADALHFMDAELTARQIARVLAPDGALALVTCGFAPTPFMQGVVRVMEEAAPRRPRELTRPIVHLSALTGIALTDEQRFTDETPIDHPTLERILRSISFIGPAMNPPRFAAFRERVHALPEAPVWARTFLLRSGRRAGVRGRTARSTESAPRRPGVADRG
ncbi:MAG TPA: class I SAM-dependent methyltransferase [Polyangia bacterium]|nr:class I SAM-dependent methyltransferase [Polyangia bacterium]